MKHLSIYSMYKKLLMSCSGQQFNNSCKKKKYYSPLKNNKMGKINNSGSATKNPKDIRIGITFIMNHPKASSRTFDYSTDLDRFTRTYEHVKNHPAGTDVYRKEMHSILMDLFLTDAPIDEYFFTIGMHYLVSFHLFEAVFNSKPNTALGFIIEPIHDDYEFVKFTSTDYNTWEYSVINRNAA